MVLGCVFRAGLWSMIYPMAVCTFSKGIAIEGVGFTCESF